MSVVLLRSVEVHYVQAKITTLGKKDDTLNALFLTRERERERERETRDQRERERETDRQREREEREGERERGEREGRERETCDQRLVGEFSTCIMNMTQFCLLMLLIAVCIVQCHHTAQCEYVAFIPTVSFCVAVCFAVVHGVCVLLLSNII